MLFTAIPIASAPSFAFPTEGAHCSITRPTAFSPFLSTIAWGLPGIYLNPKERNNTKYKLDTFSAVYRWLCRKEVVFENPSKEIFSELDEIKTQVPIFIRSFRTPGRTGGGHRPTIGRRGPAPAAPPYGGTAVAPPTRLFAYLNVPDLKPRYGKTTVRETFRAAAIAKPRWGQSLFRRRTGKCPEGFSIDTAAISTAIFITAAAPMRRE
ncbi:hypothetical protein QYE76_050451 [Lolium multiflorum]|uniref:Uncharacterized protein n=1 Tax=Lolium multiflorum TaxID=4521 RepID=A0AAD8SPZ6_LOLMU|nr:hypothetical protein QYE76_050451 [Lolium multiflorum]